MVLILVLVDNGFAGFKVSSRGWCYIMVLILVLVDNGFAAIFQNNSLIPTKVGLNPCSSG